MIWLWVITPRGAIHYAQEQAGAWWPICDSSGRRHYDNAHALERQPRAAPSCRVCGAVWRSKRSDPRQLGLNLNG